MNKTKLLRALAAGLLAGTAMLAQAATQNYVFSGTLDSGTYLGESFSGSLSFDDAALTGVGLELLDLQAVQIVFHGQTYGFGEAALAPDVAYQDGTFLGLEYSHDASLPSFTTVAGSVDATDAFLAYDSPVFGGSGAGTIAYAAALVPETSGLALTLAGLGAMVWCGRRRPL